MCAEMWEAKTEPAGQMLPASCPDNPGQGGILRTVQGVILESELLLPIAVTLAMPSLAGFSSFSCSVF